MSNNFKHAQARLLPCPISNWLMFSRLGLAEEKCLVVDVVDDVDVVESDVGKSGGETSLIADTAWQ